MVSTRARFRKWSWVEAPARLHLGFLDLNGSLGRRFGSIGVTLDGLTTRVAAARAPKSSVRGPDKARAADYIELLRQACGLDGGVELVIESSIPAHAGLGSGTQLALAVGTAVSRLFDLGLTAQRLAQLLDRGSRSGIGIGAFEQGGFLVDGGHGRDDQPPPIVSRMDFPTHWRIVLVLDPNRYGLHGQAEVKAFRTLPRFPEGDAACLCRLMLMQALPALACADLAAFGAAVTETQRVVGDYFAPAQGGRFTSARVAEILALAESHGAVCVGQSSWGPTGFVIVESEAQAERLVRLAMSARPGASTVDFRILRARNHGALAWLDDERAGVQQGSM